MQVTMLFADAAQVANGKLFILGGGWSVTGPEPSPSAIVLKIAVPWDQANKSHHLVLSLIDTDGNPLTASDPAGQQQPFRIEADFEAGRPAGIASSRRRRLRGRSQLVRLTDQCPTPRSFESVGRETGVLSVPIAHQVR